MKDIEFEKKEALIQAALEEFGQHGYEQASLNHILKQAAMSKGSFYHHFKDKEELYAHLFDRLFHEKMTFFEQHIDKSVYDQNIFQVLIEMCRVGFDFAKNNPDVARFSTRLLKEIDSPINKKIMRKYDDYSRQAYASLIDRAFKKGELREDLPPDFIIQMIHYLMSNIHQITKAINLDDYSKELNHVISFLKDGFSKK